MVEGWGVEEWLWCPWCLGSEDSCCECDLCRDNVAADRSLAACATIQSPEPRGEVGIIIIDGEVGLIARS